MRRVRKLKALASVLTCAAAAFSAATLSAAAPASAATCVPTQFIGVHGTGEETGIIGDELANLYNGIAAHTGMPEQGLSGWSDDSSLLVDIVGNALNPPGLLAAINKLQTAINAGATDLYNQVTSEASACPSEHFIIAGFSQGAAVVGTFARAHPDLAGKVSGIILWADPEFNGNDPLSKGGVVSGGFVSTGGWNGVLTSVYGTRYTFPSAWSGRLRSYCTTLDGVCNWTPGNVGNIPGHHGDERYGPVITDSETAIQATSGGWAPAVWDLGSEAFYTKWQSEGGVGGMLGQPTGDPVSKPGGGLVQSFAGNSCGSGSALMWTASSGMHSMDGCLYNSFVHTWGGPGGTYGYPTTDEQSTAGGHGKVNHMTGTLCGSTSGSGLFFSSAGTFPVHGCIYQRYEAIGEDRSGIGLPTSDEYAVSGGVQQNYSNGNIRDIGGAITVTYYSSTGLDNSDPYTTGCAGSAHPESTVATATDGPTKIYLQWSGYCGTNWTRVVPNLGNGSHNIEMAIWVERMESNGTITQGDTFEFFPNGTVPAWSDQLYSPVLHARACENYYTIYDKVWSTPVCTGWV